MNDGNGFRMLLKVHIGRKLNTEQETLAVEFDSRQITIRPDKNNQALKETTWIVLDAHGFPTKKEAYDYGSRLRDAVYVAAICSRLGADPGLDENRSSFNEEYPRSQGALSPHSRLAPDRHRLVILPEDGINFFLQASVSQVTHRVNPTQFMGALTDLTEPLPMAEVGIPVRLLNLAMMSNDGIARIVLANAAVESLVNSPGWSRDQKDYIDKLAAQTEHESSKNSDFKQVAKAIHNLLSTSIRWDVKQLLNDEALFEEWKDLYGKRSRLIHGSKSKSEDNLLTEEEIGQLATNTVSFCAKIILIHLKRKGIDLPEIANTNYGSL